MTGRSTSAAGSALASGLAGEGWVGAVGAGADMDYVDNVSADESALLGFERWAPDMPWEISTGKTVLTGELTVYPAPPAAG